MLFACLELGAEVSIPFGPSWRNRKEFMIVFLEGPQVVRENSNLLPEMNRNTSSSSRN